MVTGREDQVGSMLKEVGPMVTNRGYMVAGMEEVGLMMTDPWPMVAEMGNGLMA
jgi:hypothetical protein